MEFLVEEELPGQVSFDELQAQIDSKEVLDKIRDKRNIEDWFEVLVPDSGKADTVAGEIVRAMSRIQYRDYNDGDLFYTGYGVETCGSSAAYLMEVLPENLSKYITDIADDQLSDDEYTQALDKLAEQICIYLLHNPELITKPNESDSRDDYELPDEYIPKFDFNCEIPSNVIAHIEAGNISEEDLKGEVYYWETGYGSIGNNSDNIEIQWDQLYIDGLDQENYDELERNMDRWLEQYGDDLDNEYGVPGQDNNDEDEEE